MSVSVLLSLHLSVAYGGKAPAIRDLSLEIHRGEILGLVGQSGCGKSTLALAIFRLLHMKGGKAEGSIVFNGRNLMAISEREMRSVRGKEIGLVLQSPMSALNPALKIGTQLGEAWKVHKRGSSAECRQAVMEALENVSLPNTDSFLNKFPSQLSVGQAQRVLIAMAVMHRPTLLIADEPTSALDIITQSEILQLFARLSRDLGMTTLYISHDLLSVSTISDRVAVMEKGAIVECRKTMDVFRNPENPYTQNLIRALPVRPTFAKAAVAGNAESH